MHMAVEGLVLVSVNGPCVGAQDGRIAREHSVTLREEAKILLKRAEDIQKTAHETVNRSVTQKMAETDNLMVFSPTTSLNWN